MCQVPLPFSMAKRNMRYHPPPPTHTYKKDKQKLCQCKEDISVHQKSLVFFFLTYQQTASQSTGKGTTLHCWHHRN